jgi:MATE family multidrug resistance protein
MPGVVMALGMVVAVRGIRAEFWPTLRLAGPVILAELGWIAMGVVDTLIVGPLGAEAIGAVGLGSSLFFAVAIFGIGMLLGLDTLVAQSFGAGKPDDARRWLGQGLFLALFLTVPLTALVWWVAGRLDLAGLNPAILPLVAPYLRAISWSLGPLLIFAAIRRYFQATDRVGVIVFALVSANLVNVVANWVLVFGHGGVPALGVAGSGWATTSSRVYMMLVLAVAAWWFDRRRGLHDGGRWPIGPDPARIRRLVALGLPAAGHVTLEVGVFALATALAGQFDPVSLAAHNIVLNVACVTFMVPLGLSSAGAVRVGQAIGRGAPADAARAGWAAIALGGGFMATSGLTFWLIPRAIMTLFSTETGVVATGLALLQVAAGFQLFDGLQGVTTGALRGAGDTRTSMVAMLSAHWFLGLPVGYVLAFPAGLGVVGLWIGLSVGLIAAGLILIRAWTLKARALRGGMSSFEVI